MSAVSYINLAKSRSRINPEWQATDLHPPTSSVLLRQAIFPAPMNDIRPSPACQLEGARVFIAGHAGLVGSALARRLSRERCEILTVGRSRLDLRRQLQTESWMAANRPDIVILAAATRDGMTASGARPADLLLDNLAISQNVIEASRHFGVKKLVFLGSDALHPRFSPQIAGDVAQLPGVPELEIETYALAKMCGLRLIQAMRRQHGCDFISVFPSPLYGPGDRFDTSRERAIPALMRRFFQAKITREPECVVSRTGQSWSEFLHVDDCADGIVHALQFYSGDEPLNLGSGEDVSIATLAKMIADITGYTGRIAFARDRQEGMSGLLLDSSRMNALGWRPRINLRDGLYETYRWWRKQELKPSLAVSHS